MSGQDIVRAWKDPDRPGTDAEHPAGEIAVYGGGGAQVLATEYILTMGCCGGFSQSTCGCTWGLCGDTSQCTGSYHCEYLP